MIRQSMQVVAGRRILPHSNDRSPDSRLALCKGKPLPGQNPKGLHAQAGGGHADRAEE